VNDILSRIAKVLEADVGGSPYEPCSAPLVNAARVLLPESAQELKAERERGVVMGAELSKLCQDLAVAREALHAIYMHARECNKNGGTRLNGSWVQIRCGETLHRTSNVPDRYGAIAETAAPVFVPIDAAKKAGV
jgi:hypothetical protein